MAEMYDIDGSIAYRVLAKKHFSQFSDRIRLDLREGFSSIKEARLDRWRKIPGVNSDALISDWASIDDYLRTIYTEAALEGLTLNGSATDLSEGRKYLASAVPKIVQFAITIVQRWGDRQDAPVLLRIASQGFGNPAQMASRAALILCASLDCIFECLDSGKPVLVRCALEYARDRKMVLDLERVEPLLKSKQPGVRYNALLYLVKTLSKSEFETMLERALQSGVYYYDMVALIDKFLYAPSRIWDRALNELESDAEKYVL